MKYLLLLCCSLALFAGSARAQRIANTDGEPGSRFHPDDDSNTWRPVFVSSPAIQTRSIRAKRIRTSAGGARQRCEVDLVPISDHMTAHNHDEGGVYWGFYVRLDENIQNPTSRGIMLTQFKGWGTGGPPFRLSLEPTDKSSGKVHVNATVHYWDNHVKNDDVYLAEEIASINRDEWVHFTCFVKYDSGPGKTDGQARVWMNGRRVFTYDGQFYKPSKNGGSSRSRDAYIKFGLYGSGATTSDAFAYFDEAMAGTTFASVQPDATPGDAPAPAPPPPPAEDCDVSAVGSLPWSEGFGQGDGTTCDRGATRWSARRDGPFGVVGRALQIGDAGGQGVWRSQPIDIGGAGEVEVSLRVAGGGSLDAAGRSVDYLRVYTRVDGGPERLLAEDLGEVDRGRLSARVSGGDELELVIRALTTGDDESYRVDDVRVAAVGDDGADDDDGPDAPQGGLPPGSYEIVNVSNGQFLYEKPNGGITVAASPPGASRTWEISADGGAYRLRNASTSAYAVGSSDAKVLAGTDDGEAARWTVTPLGGGRYAVANLGRGRALALNSKGWVRLRDDDGEGAQWRFEPVVAGRSGERAGGGSATRLAVDVFPNPASTHVAVRPVDASDDAPLRVRLIDPLGRVVRDETLGGGQLSLNLDGVARGAYLLRIRQGGAAYETPLVVAR